MGRANFTSPINMGGKGLDINIPPMLAGEVDFCAAKRRRGNLAGRREPPTPTMSF